MILRGVIKDNRYSAEYSEVWMFGKRILWDWIELEKNGRIRGIPLIDERANEKPAGGEGGGGLGGGYIPGSVGVFPSGCGIKQSHYSLLFVDSQLSITFELQRNEKPYTRSGKPQSAEDPGKWEPRER